jgi:F-type H+-transporting ATPase subunit a
VPLLDFTALIGRLMGFEGFAGIGGTATQSIWVTGGLAICAFVFYSGTAIWRDWKGFLMHLTGGAPLYLAPIMVPIEILGTLIKPVVLALRLAANMTGGHLVIAVLLGFVGQLVAGLGGGGYLLAGFPILGAIAITFLEILVSLIQAFIFVFLTTLFLGQLIIHGDEHGEEHDHAQDPPEVRAAGMAAEIE